jgi:hypothetical protein
MWGYWLEGGSRAFYFQALYRWTGGLHVVFGDSRCGRTDASSAARCWRFTSRTVAGFR